MSTWESIFLGIVQGLTEFLPVSSSGHLVLFQNFLGLHEGQLSFDIAVHVGTLLSVLTVYRKPIGSLLRDVFIGLSRFRATDGLKLFFYVCLASVPTGLMGIFLRDYWSSTFAKLHWVGVFLIVTGFILLKTRKSLGSDPNIFGQTYSLSSINWLKALLIGCAQGFAILPGVSRSGTTISVGLFLGLDRGLATFFSFLLMIPAVMGASLLEFSHVDWSQINWTLMMQGFVTAYVFGLIGLLAVIRLVKKGRLELFSPYLFLLGGGLIVYALFQ